MDVYLVALFPEVLDGFRQASIVGRAVEQGLVRFHGVQIAKHIAEKLEGEGRREPDYSEST